MIDLKNCRCLQFMPANNPAMILSSDILGADAIIFDLEDSVSIGNKDAARTLLKHSLNSIKFIHSRVIVRINPMDSEFFIEDLKYIFKNKNLIDAILLPKSSLKDIVNFENILSKLELENNIKSNMKILLLIESPRDLIDIKEILEKSTRAIGICLGGEDYATNMGIKRNLSSKELEYARFVIATYAKAFDISSFDTPFTDIDNQEGLENDCKFAKSIGFSGKMSINPRHIDTVQQYFSPTKDEIMEAKSIVTEANIAKKQGLGVFSYKGKMIDLPVVSRAKNIVDLATKLNLIGEDYE